MSETWLTEVPDAAPRYRTLAPGLMWMLSTPASTEAASFDLEAPIVIEAAQSGLVVSREGRVHYQADEATQVLSERQRAEQMECTPEGIPDAVLDLLPLLLSLHADALLAIHTVPCVVTKGLTAYTSVEQRASQHIELESGAHQMYESCGLCMEQR